MKEAEEEEEESLLKDFPHLLFSPLLLIFLGSFYPIRKDLVDFLSPPPSLLSPEGQIRRWRQLSRVQRTQLVLHSPQENEFSDESVPRKREKGERFWLDPVSTLRPSGQIVLQLTLISG